MEAFHVNTDKPNMKTTSTRSLSEFQRFHHHAQLATLSSSWQWQRWHSPMDNTLSFVRRLHWSDFFNQYEVQWDAIIFLNLLNLWSIWGTLGCNRIQLWSYWIDHKYGKLWDAMEPWICWVKEKYQELQYPIKLPIQLWIYWVHNKCDM